MKWQMKFYYIAVIALAFIFIIGCDDDNDSITGFERGKLTWERIYSSDGTYYNSMSVSADGILYVGTRSNILRYDENVDSMVVVREGDGVKSLAISKNGTVYAGSDRGMLRSSNGGQDWEDINTGLESAAIWDIDINGADDIFIATGKGTFVSSNNGKNWSSLTIDSTVSFVQSLAVSPNGSLFATDGRRKGVYRSNNNGLSWSKVIDSLAFNIAINSQEDIFAGVFKQSWNSYDIIRSTDEGVTWKEIDPFTNNNFVYSIVFDSQDDVYIVNKLGILRSFDNGDTWIAANDGLPAPYIRTMVVSKNDVFYCGVDFDGIFRGTFDRK